VFEIGSSLREARVRQGLDLNELEQATKIRAKYLRALEDEEFDLLPAQTYVKGFLRSYAEYLGLDGQVYVDEYNSRFAVGDEEVARPRRSSRQPRGVQVQSRVLVLTLLGIAAVAALVIIAWKSGEPQKETPVGLATSQGKVSTRPARPAGAANVVRLHVIAARGPCWLQVHRNSATGKILYQGTLERGQRQTFTAKKLWITLDRPENLRTILNERSRRLPVGGVKTLLVTPRGIRPAV
jgi:Helix-turn-helix domain/RodZ C-terminal domain